MCWVYCKSSIYDGLTHLESRGGLRVGPVQRTKRLLRVCRGYRDAVVAHAALERAESRGADGRATTASETESALWRKALTRLHRRAGTRVGATEKAEPAAWPAASGRSARADEPARRSRPRAENGSPAGARPAAEVRATAERRHRDTVL